MELFLDILVAILLILGCLMSLIAGIGLLTFPDMLTRMHAATKPQTMGLVLMAIGFGLVVREWPVWAALLLAVLFQFLTAPVAAHMIGRGALRTGQVRLPLYEDPGVSADARDDD